MNIRPNVRLSAAVLATLMLEISACRTINGAPATCASDEVVCGTSCVQVQSDPLHCGSCEVACSENQICSSGLCSGGLGGGTGGGPFVSGTGGGASGGSEPGGSGGNGAGGTPSESCLPDAPDGHFQMEDLDRGLLAVHRPSGNYVGWRMLGYEYKKDDPTSVSYNLYRDGTLLDNVKSSTNYFDEGASADASYAVSLVNDGSECERSAAVVPWGEQFVNIPLTPPEGGTASDGVNYAYNTGTSMPSSGGVNDGSVGDVDGDGQYEVIVIWEPSNAQDNSKSGFTGPVYMDCYELSGERRWRLNLGPNIRAGAHYTQFVVYDFDGDGKAEVAVKTAPGTKDGTGVFLSKGPAAGDDDSADYRNDSGYVLSGPEYLTVFSGETGAELSTVNFEIARGDVGSWGDDYGNRVDRFLASAGFVSDLGGSGVGSGRPAILMARGYYTRATVTAWTFRDGELKKIWTADSESPGAAALVGQGAHSMSVADVDGDLAQEVIYGAAMIQSDGSFGCSSNLFHGDALHTSDFIPSRPGLETFMPQEHTDQPWWHIRDAASCEIVHQADSTGKDNGRGVAADILASNPGAEMWSSSDSNLRSCTTGEAVGARPGPINFLMWWDADESRELEDGNQISKGDGTVLLTCNDCVSNNYTKSTPTLTADLFGDWREEIIWRSPTSDALRVYTTTDLTSRRIYTLMHDPQYRMQVSSEMTAYNQPPHVGFHIGADMIEPPEPDVHVK